MLNKTGGIGATANLTTVILVAIAVLAIISPVTNSMFENASNAGNLTGIESLVVEHFNVILLFFFTMLLFFSMWVMRGGSFA